MGDARQRRRPEKTAPSNREVVLVSLVGMSPAVLTETVWALARRKPAVIPHRVVALTTAAGRREIERQLFQPVEGFSKGCVWDALLGALDREGHPVRDRLRFGLTGSDILVVTARGPSGRSVELEDVGSEAENQATGDFFLQEVRKFTDNPAIRLIVSIAGGRKTMSALLYGVMSLVGREEDEVVHVLVPRPYEDPELQPRFYFPGQPGVMLCSRRAGKVSASKAKVSLATIPFVPLRNAFPEIGGLPGGFLQVMDHYRTRLGEDLKAPVIGLEPEGIVVDGVAVPLGRRARLLMEFLLVTNQRGRPLRGPQDAVEPFFKQFLPGRRPDEEWCRLNGGEQDIRGEKERIRKALRSAGIRWMPGVRRLSMTLPSFRWENPSPGLSG